MSVGQSNRGRTQIVRECEIYKEERDALEKELREIDECDMESLIH